MWGIRYLVFIWDVFIGFVVPIYIISWIDKLKGLEQILAFIVVLTIFFWWQWRKFNPKGVGDDDPAGNDNVRRKFTDFM